MLGLRKRAPLAQERKFDFRLVGVPPELAFGGDSAYAKRE